jgi:hypothetical protein
VAANFEYDRDRWHPGEEFRCGLWVINDDWLEIPGAEVRWRITGPGGQTAVEGTFPATMAPDSARKLGDITWRAKQPGKYALTAGVRDASGHPISENVFEFEVQ